MWYQIHPDSSSAPLSICEASLNGNFTRVSFAFNSLPHMHFWWYGNILMKREELSFMGIKLSWHSYQLSMSHRIKYLWNYGIKLSIENGCFIQVSFHSIWHGSLENILFIEIDLTPKKYPLSPRLPDASSTEYERSPRWEPQAESALNQSTLVWGTQAMFS
jgi:hypothetical protein